MNQVALWRAAAAVTQRLWQPLTPKPSRRKRSTITTTDLIAAGSVIVIDGEPNSFVTGAPSGTGPYEIPIGIPNWWGRIHLVPYRLVRWVNGRSETAIEAAKEQIESEWTHGQ